MCVCRLAAEMKVQLVSNKALRQRWRDNQQQAAEVAIEVKKALSQLQTPEVATTSEQIELDRRMATLEATFDMLHRQWQQKCGDEAKIEQLKRLRGLPDEVSEISRTVSEQAATLEACELLSVPEVNASRV